MHRWVGCVSNLCRLLYSFYIIEYLMASHDLGKDAEYSEYLTKNDAELTAMISTWASDFIQFGGFNHLYTIFLSMQKKTYQDYHIFDKKILSFILKMFLTYLTASFSTEVDGLYRIIQLSNRIYLNLDFIEEYL